jgi:ABC-type transport system substrate-binding protein
MRAVPNNRVTFLALNPARTELADPALRRALACVIDPHTMVGEGALPFGSFVPSGPWSDNEQLPPCLDMPAELRIQNAAQILNQAGYTWRLAPAETPGAATLILPGGFLLRPLVLLTTAAEDDPLRFQAAQYIAQQAGVLGISTTLQALDPHSLRYAVYSTAGYDLALLSWRLGEYPAYLCDWFLPPAPFTYQDERLQAGCQSMRSTADLPAALQAAYEIQSALLEDLPLIPLYQGVQYEAIQNVTYPFDSVENGISGLYGAPELAVPSY